MSKSIERQKGRKLRPYILERDNYTCLVDSCQSHNNLQAHHFNALHNGGKSAEWNMGMVCDTCHWLAPETGLEEFKQYKTDKHGYIIKEMNKVSNYNYVITAKKMNNVSYTMLVKKLNEYMDKSLINVEQRNNIVDYEIKLAKHKERVL